MLNGQQKSMNEGFASVLIRRLKNGWIILQRRGLRFLGYLLTDYLVPRICYFLLERLYRWPMRKILRLFGLAIAVSSLLVITLLLGLFNAILIVAALVVAGIMFLKGTRRLDFILMRRQARAFTKKAQSASAQQAFTSWSQWPVENKIRQAVESARKMNPDEEIAIGRIDNDGRVLGLFGQLPGVENISPTDFVQRYRFPLDIVLINNNLLLRKDFRGDKERLIHEWHNLAVLQGKANVPTIFRVDEARCLLYKNFLPGRTIRDILVKAGARILNVQTDHDRKLAELDKAARLEEILARGTALIPACFSEDFLCEFENQLEKIHASGVVGLSLTFGNILVDSEKNAPWFIDFEGARSCTSTSSLGFSFRRDQDRAKFNRIYGRSLLTEKSARVALARQSAKIKPWYAPADFGKGLTVGGFWSTDSGTGRWEFLNRHVVNPLIKGKRVLDLGSYNGVMPMMMLRAGAREVLGVEFSPLFVQSASLIHRIYEWRDRRKYAFHFYNGDMRDILEADWGKFDVVTAFCSLYYLQAKDMARVVRKAAKLAPIMVLQAKTQARPEARDKGQRSSIGYLKKILQENGFPSVEIFSPSDYTRPLLVGRTIPQKPKIEEKEAAAALRGQTKYSRPLRLKYNLTTAWVVLRRRGPGYFWHLLAGYLAPKVFYRLAYKMSRPPLRNLSLAGAIGFGVIIFLLGSLAWGILAGTFLLCGCFGAGFLTWISVKKSRLLFLERRARILFKRAQLANAENTYTSWAELPICPQTRLAVEAAQKANPKEELIIGRLDNDGKVFGLFGDLSGINLETIRKSGFVERYRYPMDIVLVEDKVLVRKDFRSDKESFVKELYCHALLSGKVNVPCLYRVDEKKHLLYKNFIFGRKIWDVLIDAGAKIRFADLKEMERQGFDPVEQALAISARAREMLPACFSEKFLQELEYQVNLVHSQGIANFGFTIGNVIVGKEEKPWFFDFERAHLFRSTRSLFFAYRRDQDRMKFNRFYGDRMLTERSARAALARELVKVPSSTETMGWYASIDFGKGLAIGGLGSTETGTGRWEYLNKYVISPLAAGKRVLDLGSNNGFMPIMILKAGAREVVGVELSPELVERARLVQRIFEWRDMREYAFTIHNCDILEILKADWGHFDLVTAFCSLYFLEANNMARVLHRASEIAPTIVLQANTRVPRSKDGRAERASVEFLEKLLKENGFLDVKVFGPKNYSRPLLVGRTSLLESNKSNAVP